MAAAATVCGCGVEGLHNANPTTVIRVDPSSKSVYLSNNKDVDVSFDELTYTKDGSVSVKNLKITDKASSVRAANVEQIHALAVESKAIGEAWSMGLQAGAQFVAQFVPMVGGIQRSPPWGAGNSAIVPPGWTAPATTQPTQ
jgi:hypothetical protein